MANCVFLTHSAASSGAELSLLTQLSFWPEGQGRPLVVLAEDGPIVKRAADLGIKSLIIPLDTAAQKQRRGDKSFWRTLRGIFSLCRLGPRVARSLTESRADVVVAISIKSLVYGLLAGRRAGTRVVWSIHDRISPDYFPKLVVLIFRYVVPRLVDGIMVNSRSTLSTIRPGRTPVLVAHPGVILDEREFFSPTECVRSVVMLGRLAPWKGQDNFLRAFAQVFRDTDTRAIVVGGALFGETDYERSLVHLSTELRIADQVEFTGHVEDAYSLLVNADIMTHCSIVPEPFGQVVVQGMWARCAVIATRPGGPAEVITDRVDGLLVQCGDVTELAAALAQLRDDSGLRRRLAANGRASARRYDATRSGPQVADWLARLARNEIERGSIDSTLNCGLLAEGETA